MKTINHFLMIWIACISILLFSQCQKTEEITSVPVLSNASNELEQQLTSRGVQHYENFIKLKINNCIETIYLSGNYKFIVQDFKITNGGHFSLRSHFELKGNGTGLKSGNQYEWMESGGKSFSGDFENGQYHQTYRSNERLIGHGDVPNSTFSISYTFRVNANGEIVVDDWKASSSCD